MKHCKVLVVLIILVFTSVHIFVQISIYDVLEEDFVATQSQQYEIVYPSSKEIIQRMVISEEAMATRPLFNYIHLPPTCKFNGNKERNVLILVKSAVKNSGLRNVIRQTWGGAAKKLNVILYFMLAFNNTSVQTRVEIENKIFNDLVQQDFQDAYLNNTYKTIMSFHFAETYCHSANLVLFIDDDFYLDIDHFMTYVFFLNFKTKLDIFEGFLIKSGPVRDVKSKWFVSYDDYPFARWPLYLAGGAYVATMPVIKKFNLVFPKLCYIGIDDAWLGIVALIAEVEPSDNYLFHNTGHFSKFAFIITDSHDPKEMKNKWEKRNKI